ncbi:MAG: nuclear transport factor 2 family protein [Gemmatimonadota bacterium]
MTTEVETRALGRELIDAFGKAWERGKVDQIVELFSEEAVFLDDPFAGQAVGKNAIRDYWKDVPYHQSEITFTPGEIFAAGPWFSTEFRVVYRRRRTGEWVDARGAIFCETAGGKVTEMRMYWIRR